MAGSDGGAAAEQRGGGRLLALAGIAVVAVVAFGAAYWFAGDADDAVPTAGDADAASEPGDGEAAADDAADDYDVRVDADPDPPAVEGTTFVVDVAGDDGPVTGARVRIAMEMDEHAHDGVDGEGEEIEPGRYEVPIRFVMRGRWSGHVTVEGPDGEGRAREPVSYEVQ